MAERLAEKADHGKKDREDRTDKANSETHGKLDNVRGKGEFWWWRQLRLLLQEVTIPDPIGDTAICANNQTAVFISALH